MKSATLGKKAGIAAVAVLGVASWGAAGGATKGGVRESGQGGMVVAEGQYFCNVQALNAFNHPIFQAPTGGTFGINPVNLWTRYGHDYAATASSVSRVL